MAGPSATWAGTTAGGGVDIPLSRIHLRPEFRCSHWFAQNGASGVATIAVLSNPWVGPAVPGGSSFSIQQNEASFLLGVTF